MMRTTCILAFLTLTFLPITGWSGNEVLECRDRHGMYNIKAEIDFTRGQRENIIKHYCGRGECYDDPYDGYTCKCLPIEFPAVKITRPVQFTVETLSHKYHEKGYVELTGSSDSSDINSLEIQQGFREISAHLRIQGQLQISSRRFDPPPPMANREDLYLSWNWLDLNRGAEERIYLDCTGLH